MAFTTGGQRLGPAQRRIRQQEELSAALKDRIDDLESAYLCNVSLLLDITSARTASRHEHSRETETQHSFPAPCYKKLKEQQRLLKEASHRLSAELAEAKDRGRAFDRLSEETKSQENKTIKDMQVQVRECKRRLQEQDRTIQSLEKEQASLDREAAIAFKDKEEGGKEQLTAGKLKKLVREVKHEVVRVDREKEIIKERCQVRHMQELESGLGADRDLFKARNRRRELTKVQGNQYGLELSYENYWFPRAHSLSSSSESSSEVPLPKSKAKPGDQKSMVLQKTLKANQTEAMLQAQAAKIEELHLAYRMKQDETKSLLRLSEQLSHFRDRLLTAIEKFRGTRSEKDQEERLDDFAEEVQWEDSIFHDSPSDQR